MKRVEAIIKPHKLEDVKKALSEMGIQGMTVSEARGFGRTEGKPEVFAGSAYVVDFVPKVRVEILIDDRHLHQLLETISAAARTGQIGDGKIFVPSLDEIIRIRTGEHGEDAI